VIEEVNKQLCNKVLASDMTEDEIIHTYYTEYANQKFDLSEAGQDQMFANLGECFEQEMYKLIANNSELDSKVKTIYKTLAESITHLSTIDYIRNGGGTMWGHNGNRQIGL
jgi:succinate dehydrogenase flavin-adding protein (antitoxin of CptAB toxin-antitoxin module)